MRLFSAITVPVCLLFAAMAPAAPANAASKIIIAHRGASGYLPEHTLEAYAFAYALGADYVEQDLVRTRDGAFICRHDIHLDDTTNVAEVFPDRKRADGSWYAMDFTLAEIRQIKAVERTGNRFPKGASSFAIPTFEEAIELVQGLNKTTGRQVGIYPELKDPGIHRKANLAMEEDFLKIVARYGYAGRQALIYVQCFDPNTLKRLRNELHCDLPMIQLISDSRIQDSLMTDAGLKEIAAVADGIGPDKGRIEKEPGLVARAHAAGLKVHPYTMRRDELPKNYASFGEELRRFYFDYDVDGVFTDFSDEAVKALGR